MNTSFKRIVSLFCVIALLCSFGLTAFAAEESAKKDISITSLDPANKTVYFNGLEDGDEVSVDFDEIKMELYREKTVGLSTDVVKANVCDYVENDKVVYDSYNVDYNKDTSIVKITMKNLKPHKNAHGEVAFWTGFAVKAPEGAKKFTYYLAEGSSSNVPLDVEIIDAEGTEGVAFYLDAQNPAHYVELQWFDENGEAISELESASIDINAVELYTVDAEVSEAIICDSTAPESEIYADYNVSEKNDEVKITTKDLKPHKNAHGEVAFWTGFAVKAPEGAEKFNYRITAPYYDEYYDDYDYYRISSGYDIPLETIDAEGNEGVAFYLDAERFFYDEKEEKILANVELAWCDAEGNPIAATTYYTVDLTDVELYTIKDTFTEAVVCDHFKPDAETPVYAEGTYEVAYNEKANTIAISMDELKLHENANHKIGFWTGFAVKAPAGAEKFDYEIYGHNYCISSGYDVSLETIDAEGTEGVAFYFDAGDYCYYDDGKLLAYVNLTWCDAEGNPIAATNYYTVDLTDVECDFLEAPEIGVANVADYDSEDEVYTEDSYNVTADYDSVKIEMKGLKKHTNGNGKEGYWTGFSVKAPEGATHYEYFFYGPENYTESAGIKELGENEDSLSFYVDAGDINAKNTIYIGWYSDDETPFALIDSQLYPIDITGVELADVAPITAKEATIACTDNVGKVVYADGSYSAILDGNKIKISAEDLKAHMNAAGDRGAWVGAEFVAPENASFAKYAFTTTEEAAKEDWLFDNWETVSADEASFYVNAFESADEIKDVIMLQWFDADGYALSNIGTYTLDLSDVDYKVSDVEMIVEAAPIVDQDNPEADTYYGEPEASLSDNKITLNAGYIFNHNSDGAGYGAWLGFIGKVEGAKYLRYAFYDSEESRTTWYNANETEVDGQESFYVDAFDPKDTLMLQWFDENGDALTNVNAYTIAVSDLKYGYEDYFRVLFSNIKLTGKDADKYNLVYDGWYPNIADNEYVGSVSTKDYVYADVLVFGNGSVSYDGERYNVFFRDKDYSDGIDTVKIKATPDDGYNFKGFYSFDDEVISSSSSYEAPLDDCYSFYAAFEKRTGGGSFGGGGGLVAGGGSEDKKDETEDNTDDTTGETDQPEQTLPGTSLSFTDVAENAWYYADVKTAAENGLMNGISSSIFAPNASLTRAMFVTILYRAAGEPGITHYSSFTDVPANQYYANAVAWASANGIVNGVSADNFAPNANITREQMAAIIYRYGTAAGIVPASDDDISYTDADKIAAYAQDAAKWAYNAGIILGNSDGSFAPSRTATRAEAAAIFVRLLALIK